MDWLNAILTGLTVASALGAIAATFYSVKQKQTIIILKDSNDAYKERNTLLEQNNNTYQLKITELEGRITSLENLKTPSFTPIIELIEFNHKEVMKALGDRK